MQAFLQRSLYFLFIYGGVISTYAQKTPFTSEQKKMANTAASVNQLSDMEKEVVMYLNLVRMYPKQFFNLYADSMALVDEIDDRHPNYTSLKERLMDCEPSPAFTINTNLLNMATEMRNDIGPNGIVGHTDSKKQSFAKRAKKFKLTGECGENIDFGNFDALAIVFSWLFDIDVDDYGHRENILNKNYRYIGLKYGDHKKFGNCCVLDFSD